MTHPSAAAVAMYSMREARLHSIARGEKENTTRAMAALAIWASLSPAIACFILSPMSEKRSLV